jgi:hypothetical protein
MSEFNKVTCTCNESSQCLCRRLPSSPRQLANFCLRNVKFRIILPQQTQPNVFAIVDYLFSLPESLLWSIGLNHVSRFIERHLDDPMFYRSTHTHIHVKPPNSMVLLNKFLADESSVVCTRNVYGRRKFANMFSLSCGFGGGGTVDCC